MPPWLISFLRSLLHRQDVDPDPHLFCECCACKLRIPRCPECNRELVMEKNGSPKLIPAMLVRRKVLALKCHCENKELGCPFTGKLRDYLLEHIPMCGYQQIACPDCSEKMLLYQLRSHKQLNCLQRSVVCPHCQEVSAHRCCCSACVFSSQLYLSWSLFSGNASNLVDSSSVDMCACSSGSSS